jgi:hypothetical protein
LKDYLEEESRYFSNENIFNDGESCNCGRYSILRCSIAEDKTLLKELILKSSLIFSFLSDDGSGNEELFDKIKQVTFSMNV